LCCTLAGPPKPPYIPPVSVYGTHYYLKMRYKDATYRLIMSV